MTRTAGAAAIAMLAWGTGLLQAQRGGGDWMTIGGDAQRSNWIRGDGKINPATMAQPGFQKVWAVKLNNQARGMNSISQPALLDFYISYRGFRTLGFVGGSSDNVIALDTDLARLEWERPLGPKSAPASKDDRCPGGMTSSVARPSFAAYPPNVGLRGFGRSVPAKSGVGEPFQGAVTLNRAAPPAPPRPAAPPPAARARTAPPANPFARTPLYVLAITGDGKLHSLYVSNGEEPNPAVPFLPANARAAGLIAYDNVAYAATVNGCGGVSNGVWAIDLETKKVEQWKTSDHIPGNAGFAVAPDGVLYVPAGSRLTALEPRTLREKGSYSAGSARFSSSPVIFEFKGKDLLAVASDDGRLHLVDTASPGSAVATSPVFSAPGFDAGGLASWLDDFGVRWVLAPAGGANGQPGSVKAWKVVEKGGAIQFELGWTSPALSSPITPAILNGVVFVVSSGVSGQSRGNATLYALDGISGKELWNSGTALTSFVTSGGLSAGGGRVYLSTHDGTQYAFGFPMEY